MKLNIVTTAICKLSPTVCLARFVASLVRQIAPPVASQVVQAVEHVTQ